MAVKSNCWVLVPEFPLGGAERQIHELFLNGNLDANLVDVSSKKHREFSGVQVSGLGIDIFQKNTKPKLFRVIKRLFSIYKIYKELKKNKVEVVLFYNTIFLPLVPLLKLSNIRVVFSIREFKIGLFRFPFLNLIRMCDSIFTNTPKVSSRLKEEGIHNELILNYINLNQDVPNTERSKSKLLIISNVQPHKNIDLVIRTIAGSEFTLEVAGKITDKDYHNYCVSLASKYDSKVNFLGLLDHNSMRVKLAECKCLIHPSLMEGTSNAIIDAIMTQTPLLVSDIDENLYLVDDLSAFYFRHDSPEELKEKLQFSNLDDNYYEDLRYLKIRVERKFTIENLEKICQLIKLKSKF